MLEMIFKNYLKLIIQFLEFLDKLFLRKFWKQIRSALLCLKEGRKGPKSACPSSVGHLRSPRTLFLENEDSPRCILKFIDLVYYLFTFYSCTQFGYFMSHKYFQLNSHQRTWLKQTFVENIHSSCKTKNITHLINLLWLTKLN